MVVCVLFVGFLCCFVFLVLFPPTMLRSSSCPPELTTVRAVMVRAVMEKKKTCRKVKMMECNGFDIFVMLKEVTQQILFWPVVSYICVV